MMVHNYSLQWSLFDVLDSKIELHTGVVSCLVAISKAEKQPANIHPGWSNRIPRSGCLPRQTAP